VPPKTKKLFENDGDIWGEKVEWERLRGRDGGDNLTNVQGQPVQKCHNDSPLYNKYILIIIKSFFKEKLTRKKGL
jgi:hypothetical protein